MEKFSIVRCYWDRCKGGVTHKWHSPSTPGNFLWVCKEHFEILEKVFLTDCRKAPHFTEVFVIPENDPPEWVPKK